MSENRIIGESRERPAEAPRGCGCSLAIVTLHTPRGWNTTALLHHEDTPMPSKKRRKKVATTPAKPREPSEDASDMPPVPDDVRFANSLANALSASDLLHELRGAGGLTSTAYIVGEHDTDEADALRAAAETAQFALQKTAVRAADCTNRLAEWPLVQDKDKLGEGADDAFFDGHLPEAAHRPSRACRPRSSRAGAASAPALV